MNLGLLLLNVTRLFGVTTNSRLRWVVVQVLQHLGDECRHCGRQLDEFLWNRCIAAACGVWLPERIPGWLRPPSRSDRLPAQTHDVAMNTWPQEVATELLRIHESAAGGMLVLMTRYETVRHVAAFLSDRVDALV